jgi:Protein of unknown function (DUF2442)
MVKFKIPTSQDLQTITARTEKRMARQLLAVSARYDRRSKHVLIHLNSGAIVGFPLAFLPGLENASADELSEIMVEGGGYGLHVPSLDADISVPNLLADHLGSSLMKRAIARATASRANGRLGGRPKKKKTLAA